MSIEEGEKMLHVAGRERTAWDEAKDDETPDPSWR